MRGADEASGSLFSYVDLKERVPERHPLRLIRRIVNEALASLDAKFDVLYTDFGRPSIAPERLIRASLLQILFSIRSERQLMEQMNYNLLFRWVVGLGIDDRVCLALGADKGYDSAEIIAALRHMVVTPNVAQKARHSAIEGRTTQHPGYALTQRHRMKIEEPFGWAKTVGGMAQTLHRRLDRVRATFTMNMAACNLARLPKLLAA
ncbi:transposase [Limimaricola variabilis]